MVWNQPSSRISNTDDKTNDAVYTLKTAVEIEMDLTDFNFHAN